MAYTRIRGEGLKTALSKNTVSSVIRRTGIEWLMERYDVEEICEGGMASVLLCRDRVSTASVAIKIPREDIVDAKIFYSEAKTWMSLGFHPNIVEAFYTDFHRQVPFIVLERIQRSDNGACNLHEHLLLYNGIPLHIILRWAFEICRALDYANKKINLVHQDIKPENVLITPEGHAKLTDFGISSSLVSKKVEGGTLAYMAPEQMTGETDTRSDIYSTGLVMFQMLIGELPDLANVTNEVILSHVFKQWVHFDEKKSVYVEQFCPIISKCLKLDPDKRWQNFGELLTEIEAIYKHAFQKDHREATKRIKPSPQNLTNRGLGLIRIGMKKEGLDLLQEAAVRGPYDELTMHMIRTNLQQKSYLEVARRIVKHQWLNLKTVKGILKTGLFIIALMAMFWGSPSPISDKVTALVLGGLFLWEALFNHYTLITANVHIRYMLVASLGCCILLWISQKATYLEMGCFIFAGMGTSQLLFFINPIYYKLTGNKTGIGEGTLKIIRATVPAVGGRIIPIFSIACLIGTLGGIFLILSQKLRDISLKKQKMYVVQKRQITILSISWYLFCAYVIIILYGETLCRWYFHLVNFSKWDVTLLWWSMRYKI